MIAESDSAKDNRLPYWIILLLLLLSSLSMGVLGFRKYFTFHGEDKDWIRCLYNTLQLFVLEDGDLPGPLPWELQISRFTAPFTTILTFIVALLAVFREQWMRIRIAWMKGHTVIVGFGTKGRSVLAESLQKKGKVLLVEIDPQNPNLTSNLPPRCHLLTANANSRSTLARARITKARSVFLLMGDDAQQVDVCLLIYQLIKGSGRDQNNALKCIMHLQKQEFLNTLRAHNLVRDVHEGLDLHVFNIYENSARAMFEDDPPDRSGITADSENFVQLIIFGFGQAGEALALHCAQTGHYLNGKKPKLLVIDRLAKEKVPEFLERYPTYTDYCDITYLTLEAKSPQLVQHLARYLEDPQAFNTVVVCFDNKTHNMLLALQLESMRLSESDRPLLIFARTDDNEPCAACSGAIRPYSLPSRVCSQEAVTEGQLDLRAKAIHANYLEGRKSHPDSGTRGADVAWERLSQEIKDSNRKAADHMGIKTRGIGCSIVGKDDPRLAAVFSEEEIERLSELEHRRWCAERSLAGWTYDPVRNDTARRTPYLIQWSQLPEDTRSYDRNAIKDIPAILALVNLKVVRNRVPGQP